MKQNQLLCTLALLACAVSALSLVASVRAISLAGGSITVTTTDDVIADDNACSLREAVIAANTDSPFKNCTGGSGVDTIDFAATLPKPAIFRLTVDGADENDAQTGDLDLAGELTINGSNADQLIVDGNGADRVFEILSSARVAMNGLTIRNGNPGLGVDGGGLLIDLSARLALTDSQVISNSALGGGGIKVLGRLSMSKGSVAGNQGGGILNDGGLVTLNSSEVVSNTDGYGIRNQSQGALTFVDGLVSGNESGGIYNATATATLSKLTIANNPGSGGILNMGAVVTHLTIRQSLVMSNSAASGAGILNEGVGASANIIDTRITGNQATGSGGGLFNNGIMTINGSTIDHNESRAGGGIEHFGGNLSLINDTISQNSATDNGGGLYLGANAVLQYVTVYQNRASGSGGNLFNDEAQVSTSNTIVAAAQAGGNCVNSSGFFHSQDFNLESGNSCNFTAASDQVSTDPLLGPLQDNGGPTLTHALLADSPAIDHGAATGCPATDQRGLARPQGATCDIGAYQVGALPPSTPTNTPTPSPTATATPTITQSVTPTATLTLTATEVTTPTSTASATLTPTATESPSTTPTPTPKATLVPTIPVTATPTTTPAPGKKVDIRVEPSTPTTSDVISLTVSGVYTSSCIPSYASHELVGNLIAIQSAPSLETFCLPAEFPWGYTLTVGPLEAGRYTVTHMLEGSVSSALFTVTTTVLCAPQFPDAEEPVHNAITGTEFHDQVTASGTSPIIYSLVQGPAGLAIDAATGELSWLPPDVGGTFPVTVRATNSIGSADYAFTIAVDSVANEITVRFCLSS